MPLHAQLDLKLRKTYEPSATIDDVFKGHDITFVTNADGEPVTLFIGKRKPNGHIAGERYVRTIKREPRRCGHHCQQPLGLERPNRLAPVIRIPNYTARTW
jgi:hypothetical protein